AGPFRHCRETDAQPGACAGPAPGWLRHHRGDRGCVTGGLDRHCRRFGGVAGHVVARAHDAGQLQQTTGGRNRLFGGHVGHSGAPSIMLVLMADRLGTSDASVGKLFMGALIPGVMLGAMYILYILIASFLKKDLAPAPENREPLDARALFDVFKAVMPPMGLIIAVLGSIFFGIATTTEASAVGAGGALLMAFVSKRLDMATLKESLYQTSRTSAFIFGIFIGATVFASVLRGLGGDEVIEGAITDLPFGTTTRHIYLGVLPFIALQLLALALVFWFEPLATW